MTDPETAAMLADQFKNKAKLVETKTAKKNQKFDTVLLMKILESDEVDEEDDDKPQDASAPTIAFGKKKKKAAPKRQRSMSMSSDDSLVQHNWNVQQSYEDEDYEGEGSCEGEGEEMEVNFEQQIHNNDYDDFEMSDSSGSYLGASPRRVQPRFDLNFEGASFEENDSFESVPRGRHGPSLINNLKGGQQVFDKDKKSLFREIETCKKYCETHYYNETSNKGFKKLSKKSEFYSSLIEYILTSNPKDMRSLQFLTCNFTYTSITLTDLMAVIALIDLPWQSSQNHKYEPYGERGLEITPATNMMLYKKELQKTEYEVNENIMVVHRFFDENNKNSEMKITEFLPQRVYG